MSKKIIKIIIIIIAILIIFGVYQYTEIVSPLHKKEKNCLSSGGQIATSSCCQDINDYPNLCLIGACGCNAENNHEIKICDCGFGRCFDGETCVEAEIVTDLYTRYDNDVNNYSFSYPSICNLRSINQECKLLPPEERQENCLCFLNNDNPNEVILQTYTRQDDNLILATFSVVYYESEAYNPPPDADLIDWLKNKFNYQDIPDSFNYKIGDIDAVLVYTPQSLQAFSQENIYYIRNNKIYNISLVDVDTESNRQFYDTILESFEIK